MELNVMWNFIRRWKGLERLKIFLWKVAHERLLANKRKSTWFDTSGDCLLCQASIEYTLHALAPSQGLDLKETSRENMTTESGFVQPAIPKFDGHYDHWCMLMENFLRLKEYWSLIEDGIPTTQEGVQLSEAQKKAIDEARLKDMKKYQGIARVQRAQRQALQKEFQMLSMKEGESVNEYFARTLTIVNKLRISKAKIDEVAVIEKILRSMTPKFNYVVCSIEESNDLDALTIDELQSSLLIHEQRMRPHVVEEQALKVSFGESSGGRGRGRGAMRGRGRGGRRSFDKSTMECYHCYKLGHFQYECPTKESNSANYVESGEEMLLMAYVKDKEVSKEEIWFLDSGCSNHMCDKMEFFTDLDESFKTNVTLGDNSNMNVKGKGTVRLLINGIVHILTNVFYIPELRNNLLSIGQLAEKGLEILIKQGACKIYHPENG
ncbi:hypothetical protein RIF29_24873 [Crotalaria pallida]|uniref:CCHC-type domain-containing protein n=1 Tax=Crotalaria pallida TaxID=3830 RepID=A0AAN9I3N4_CROPI